MVNEMGTMKVIEFQAMDRNEVNPVLRLREREREHEQIGPMLGLQRAFQFEVPRADEAPQAHEAPETYLEPAHSFQSVIACYLTVLPAILLSTLDSHVRLILSSVDRIPADYIWKLLLTCLAIQHYLMILFNSQIDSDLLLAAEPMSMGKAFLKFFLEMAFTMLFLHFSLLYFLLVWKLEKVLKYFYILAWLTIPILYIPPLLSKASLVAVTMTWGSFKLSFIPFITLGALGLFIIVLAFMLTCLRCGMKSDHVIPPGNAEVPNPSNLGLSTDNDEGADLV